MKINELISKKIYLFSGISFLINIFLLGIILGHGFKKDFSKNMPFPPHPEFENNSFNNTIKEAENRIESALLKEPYSKQEVLDALNKFDTVMSDLRKNIHERIASEAEKLPPKDRLKLLPRKRHSRRQF